MYYLFFRIEELIRCSNTRSEGRVTVPL